MGTIGELYLYLLGVEKMHELNLKYYKTEPNFKSGLRESNWIV